MSDIAISVQNLSKRYRIGLKEQVPNTFVGALASWIKSPLANYRQLHKLSDFRDDPLDQEGHELGATPEDVLYALRDVSFDIKKGEVVGIIGRNGAGKSTLLKILSRITEPTSGRIEVHGRVASLLEVGTGFHPELTGRENIYLNGTILGMRKAEIDRKFDEIVAFSEIEKFLDTPVKRYSSGMYVRLAFAVAAHLEPEILIVDEVLAVGDAGFQRKCLGKMRDVSTREGRTVLFVSHNVGALRTLCTQALLLRDGRISGQGEVQAQLTSYESDTASETKFTTFTPRQVSPSLTLDHFELSTVPLPSGSPVAFRLFMSCARAIQVRDASLLIYAASGVRVGIVDLRRAEGSYRIEPKASLSFEGCIRGFNLVEGVYSVGLYLNTPEFQGNLTDLLVLTVIPALHPRPVVPYPPHDRGLVEFDFEFKARCAVASPLVSPTS